MRVYSTWLILLGFTLTPAGFANEPLIPVPQLKADFDALYQGLQQAHFDLYANMSKTAMDREFNKRRAAIDKPMSTHDAQVYFQRFVALGDIMHARVDLPAASFLAYLEAGGTFFPLDIKVKDGAFYITANDSGVAAIQSGDQLVAMDGIAMSTWSQRLSAYVSADTETMLRGFYEFQFPFLLWLERGSVDPFQLTIQKADGHTQAVTVPARNRAFMREQQQQREGRLALDGGRGYQVAANHIGYLRPGPFYNIESADTGDETAFKQFIDEAFAHFKQLSAQALVIDLRDNPGGNNSFSDYMLAWIADRPFRFASRFEVKVSEQTTAANAARLKPGDNDSISAHYARAFAKRKPGDVFTFDIKQTEPRVGERFQKPVFVLVNRHTYSNGVLVAAIVQDYDFGTVLGEETNDLATTYGAMERFNLPHTGISVGYPKAFIVRPSGDDTVRGVVPDVTIETPLVETADDPVLRKALAHIKDRL